MQFSFPGDSEGFDKKVQKGVPVADSK